MSNKKFEKVMLLKCNKNVFHHLILTINTITICKYIILINIINYLFILLIIMLVIIIHLKRLFSTIPKP